MYYDMDYKVTAHQTLQARFDDFSEIKDIATHGISAGYSDFIYHWECDEFFREFEEEIEDMYYEIYGDGWLEQFKDCATFSELRTVAVWGFVEYWCHEQVEARLELAS